MNVEPLPITATLLLLNSLYYPPSTALCQSISSSYFTTSNCRSAYLVTASIAAAYLLHRFATCSSRASGGFLISYPYSALLNLRPIASPTQPLLVPYVLHPVIYKTFRV